MREMSEGRLMRLRSDGRDGDLVQELVGKALAQRVQRPEYFLGAAVTAGLSTARSKRDA